MKTLANFRSPVMAGLDPAIQGSLELWPVSLDGRLKGGHDDGGGRSGWVIKARKSANLAMDCFAEFTPASEPELAMTSSARL
jgi:hypothetical protein